MRSLGATVKRLAAEKPRGVVILGRGEEMLSSGADINLISQANDPREIERISSEGQAVFNDLASLGCPTVAAISGPWIGSNCELALACDYRIITDHKTSAIGLPQVNLGLIPGFGGTQRLPRLIGIFAALDIILGGKTLDAHKARAVGLVDFIAPCDQLDALAGDVALGKQQLKRRRLGLAPRFFTFSGFGRRLIYGKTKASVEALCRGFYLAPRSALEVIFEGLNRGISSGLLFETKELGRLVISPESKALVNLAVIAQSARALGRENRESTAELSAAVIGAGAMGAGIAGLLSRHGVKVFLKDATEEGIHRGLGQITEDLKFGNELTSKEQAAALKRIEASTVESPNISEAHLVIESVFEDLLLKKQILAGVAQKIGPHAVLGTNTSSLSVGAIAEEIARPDRVVGFHFFNPVHRMPLVEIVRAAQTSDDTVDRMAALANKLGKFPIVVKDVPGFLINRILSNYINEVGFLLEEGYTIQDIDKAAIDFGMLMGPVRTLDEVGLDIIASMADSFMAGYPDRVQSPAYAQKLVALGRRGKKNGAGFYDFGQSEAVPCPRIRELLGISAPEKPSGHSEAITTRLTMSLINEAIRCFEEGVAGPPEKAAFDQIDLGSVMGFAFPPFRGGLMYYANKLGMREVFSTLKRLEAEYGPRFSPAPGMEDRLRLGKGFYIEHPNPVPGPGVREETTMR